MDIYLVRHGESEANAGLTDRLDSSLTERGQRQAELTADRLESIPFFRIFVSPFVRTLQTVRPLCERTSIPADLEPEVCEYFSERHTNFLTFQGHAPGEIADVYPFVRLNGTRACADVWWPQHHEGPEQIYARAVRVRDRILAEFPGHSAPILFVSHAETVGRLTEAFQRVPPAVYPPWSDNCGLTLLRTGADAQEPAALILQNDTAHLGILWNNAS